MKNKMAAAQNHSRSVGRPRDETVGPQILRVARELVVSHGYEAITTEAIARAAGVSKQTIYRRWRTKADLVLDAFLEHAKTSVDDGVSKRPARVEQELTRFLRRTFVALQSTGPAIRSLMAWAQHDPEFLAAFRTRFIEPRRAVLRRIIAPSVGDDRRGGERALTAAVIALYGALWYRLLLDEPLDETFAADLARLIVRGLVATR